MSDGWLLSVVNRPILARSRHTGGGGYGDVLGRVRPLLERRSGRFFSPARPRSIMNLHQRSTLRRCAAPVAVATVVAAMLPRSLRPRALADGAALHVNFQPAGTAPTGYTADTGAAFNGTSGWQDLNGSAMSMAANTRIRNSASSPDKRYDTFLIMQLAATAPATRRRAAMSPHCPTARTTSPSESATRAPSTPSTRSPRSPAPPRHDDHRPLRADHRGSLEHSRPSGSPSPTGCWCSTPPAVPRPRSTFSTRCPPAPTHRTGHQADPAGSQSVTQQPVCRRSHRHGERHRQRRCDVDDLHRRRRHCPAVHRARQGQHGRHPHVTVTATDAAGNAGPATATFTIASLVPTSVHTDFMPAGTPEAGYTADTARPSTAAPAGPT